MVLRRTVDCNQPFQRHPDIISTSECTVLWLWCDQNVHPPPRAGDGEEEEACVWPPTWPAARSSSPPPAGQPLATHSWRGELARQQATCVQQFGQNNNIDGRSYSESTLETCWVPIYLKVIFTLFREVCKYFHALSRLEIYSSRGLLQILCNVLSKYVTYFIT